MLKLNSNWERLFAILNSNCRYYIIEYLLYIETMSIIIIIIMLTGSYFMQWVNNEVLKLSSLLENVSYHHELLWFLPGVYERLLEYLLRFMFCKPCTRLDVIIHTFLLWNVVKFFVGKLDVP